MNKWVEDALTMAHAGILGEYDVPPTAVILGQGRTVQLLLAGLRDEDVEDPDSWQDAVRAIREELEAKAVLLYFSAWTTVNRGGDDESLDTLVVQVATPNRTHYRAYEQRRDATSGVVTHLSELEGLRWDTEPENEPAMSPALGNVFAPTTDAFRQSEMYQELLDTVSSQLEHVPEYRRQQRSTLH
ncbi:hypothetical protein QQM79_08430 [Marinobacteraceae bacterium S3BR75-40.1]